MHSSLGWYRVPASLKKLASVITIIAVLSLNGALLIPTVASATVVQNDHHDNDDHKTHKNDHQPEGSVANPTVTSCGLDIAIVMDVSKSIDHTELAAMKTDFGNFVTTLSPAPNMFSVSDFGPTGTVLHVFTASSADTITAINGATTAATVGTNFKAGLLAAASTFDPRVSNANVIVLASDGDPFPNSGASSEAQAVAEANALKTAGTRIVTLGIGNHLNATNLIKLSSPDAYYAASDFTDLDAALNQVATDLCGGTVTVHKLIDEDGNPQTNDLANGSSGWHFNVGGHAVVTDNNGDTPAVSLEQGQYAVSETASPGYDTESYSCTNQNQQTVGQQGEAEWNFTVGPLDIISCTFINKPNTGTLHIVKHVVGSNALPSSFSFQVDEGAATAFDAAVPVSTHGTHTVTEPVNPNYTATYASNEEGHANDCTALTMTPNGDVTCTVTNTYIPPVQQCEDTNVTHTVVSDTTTMHGADATVLVDIDPADGIQLHSAWTASIPGASWIWSSNPPVDTVNDLTETYTKTFTIAGVPNADATLTIAADNSYSVDVNGNVAVCADATENNFAAADTCVIPQADIHTGSNTLTFTVKNWAQANGTPQSNPAGLMYKLSYTSNDCAQTQCQAGVNLLANPSFEANTVSAGSWDIFASGSSPLAWLATWLGAPVSGRPAVANAEIQSTGLLGVTASQGNQWTELDSDWFGPSNPGAGPGSVALSQTIPTIPGYTYNVSFDFMPRPGTAAGENKIEALHDATVGATADETSGAAWSTHTYSFVATGATTDIAFRDAGTPDDSLGSLLDNTSVTCVPPVVSCPEGQHYNSDHICTPDEVPTTATIHATKIVCDSEIDLPNWGAGSGPDITSSTATNFLNTHPSCHLQPNWTFQWAPASDSVNPGDNITSPASAPWTSLGVTAADGTATVNVPVSDPYVWFREVLKPGYIPFTYGTENQNDTNDQSAELYCNTDHLHYDNWDRVDGLVAGQDYYCVAFNAPIDNGGGDTGTHATINIVKNTTSGDGTFNFHITGGETNLPEHITTHETGGNVQNIDVPEGDYNITEDAQAGWALASVSCVYDNEAVGNQIAGGEAVSLDNGDEVTCTFTNRPVTDISGNPQCSDGSDNDADSKIDSADPGCHSDNDPANGSSYHPEWNNETNSDGGTPPGGGGGGGGPLSFGGGGGGGGGGILGASTNGQVLGASCGLALNQHLRRGSFKNGMDQVKTLQTLLNKYVGTTLPITGFFGPATEAAVKAFQLKYLEDVLKPWGLNAPTGLVYLATLWKLDDLECPDATPPFPTSLIPWSANPNA